MTYACKIGSGNLTHLVQFFQKTTTTTEDGTHSVSLDFIAEAQASITPHVVQRDIAGRRLGYQTHLDVSLRFNDLLLAARVMRVDGRDYAISNITHDRRAGWLSLSAIAD